MIKRLKAILRKRINARLHRWETAPLVRGLEPCLGPIFIIGPPRCGSTLVSQVLINSFDFGYISNRHARFFGGMSYYERWRRQSKFLPVDYESHYGRTASPHAPNECGEYWYQFFRRRPQYVPRDDMAVEAAQRLRASIARIQLAFGKPVLFKNLMNSGRLQVLAAAFPGAIFIEVQRNPSENVASILRGRAANQADVSQWWSLEPAGYEQFVGAAPGLQAEAQVALTRSMIFRDLHDLPYMHLMIEYEELCAEPKKVVRELANRLTGHISLRPNWENYVPNVFKKPSHSRHEESISSRLIHNPTPARESRRVHAA